jgi:hypothetical protein
MQSRMTSPRNQRPPAVSAPATPANPTGIYVDWATHWPAFVEHVSIGGTWKAFCDVPGNPSQDAVAKYLARNEGPRAEYMAARAAAADIRFERFEEDVATATQCADAVAVQALRLKLDMTRWALSKRDPTRYSDRIDHTSGGEKLVSFTLGISTA